MTRIRTALERSLFAVSILFAAILWTSTLAAQDTASLYKSKCAACHGTDGKGDTAVGKRLEARDFASPEVQKESDAELIQITAKGKKKMPGYEKQLKETEIKDLVAYLRQLAKGK
jgi:cytochrome c6